AMADVWFAANNIYTEDKNTVELSAEILALPDVKGSGNVKDLRQAMAQDESGRLQALVEDWIAETDTAAKAALLDQILFVWTGSDSYAISSRGASIDGRKLYVLEAFLGQDFLQYGVDPNPGLDAAVDLMKAYKALADYVSAQLLAQTSQKYLYELVGFRLATGGDSQNWIPDLTQLLAYFAEQVELNESAGLKLVQDFGYSLKSIGDEYSQLVLSQLVRAEAEISHAGLKQTLFLLNKNIISGNSGNNTLTGTAGDDVLIGGTGSDHMEGGAGNDTYVFSIGDGQDTIYDYEGTNAIRFTDVNLDGITFSRSGDHLVIAYGENDRITVQYHFLPSIYRIARVEFADGSVHSMSDLLETNPVHLSAGADNFTFGIENDIVHGGAGNDTIYGGAGNDLIYGGAGNDKLYGDAGNDTLIGEAGNDHMEGGAGDDTYVFSIGDGQDTIYDYQGTNAIRFTDVNVDEITFSRSGDHLVIGYGENDSITVQYHFLPSIYRIARIEFADGSVHSMSDLLETNPVHLSAGADNFTFGIENDIVHGGAGNDTIYGGAGNDLIYGGAGNDKLYGDAGNDTLIGEAGNDHMEGGAGDDTYVFSIGDGQDTIYDYEGTNTIRFTDVNVDEITFSRSGDHLVIAYGENDRITVQYHFYSPIYRIARIEFADGSVRSMSDLFPIFDGIQGDVIYGDAGNDKLYGGDNDDTLIGNKGNDYLDGGAGDDAYVFSVGDGQDSIFDSKGINTIRFTDVNVDEITFSRSGDDLIINYGGGDSITVTKHFYHVCYRMAEIEFADGSVYSMMELLESKPVYLSNASAKHIFGADNDIVYGGSGNDTIYGGAENDLIYGGAGNDYLYGEYGNDTLIGGTGNDYLDGGVGDDTYVFSKGDGQDTISDLRGTNTIRFSDVNVDEITFSRSGDNLVINYGNGDSITVTKHFYHIVYRMAEIEFADGSVYSMTELLESKPVYLSNASAKHIFGADNDIVYGGSGNDTIYGGAENDLIYGGAGNDYLYGEDGNDTLIGGTGNDYLDGGVGDDTYVFSKGDGQDTISDPRGTNTIRFTDVNVDEITFSRSGDNLVINYGNGDSITVTKHFYHVVYRIAQIEFADGSVYSMPELLKANPVYLLDVNNNLTFGAENDIVYGGSGNDTIRGGEGNDLIYGGAGNDKLYGDAGNDTIIGGNGDDYLEGGLGDDTYVFSIGDGQDTIFDSQGANIIRFSDVNVDEITFSRSGDYLLIGYGENDQIAVMKHFEHAAYRITQIEFADGSAYQLNALLVPIPFVTGVVYQLSDFIPHEPEPVIDDEGGFSDDIISFTGLNLDELDSMNNGETVQTAGETLDGLMELSSGFAEEDYLPDDGDWVDVTLAGVQLPEEGHYGL
ncbi:MAG: hypothetical protein FWG81_07355, partial [Betaproteobacteria bacterium]|nr:hypothetical protein [Betaproteobacteria bacterium]